MDSKLTIVLKDTVRGIIMPTTFAPGGPRLTLSTHTMWFQGQVFRCHTQRLMTQMRNFESMWKFQLFHMDLVSQSVYVLCSPLCIWKLGLDHPIVCRTALPRALLPNPTATGHCRGPFLDQFFVFLKKSIHFKLAMRLEVHSNCLYIWPDCYYMNMKVKVGKNSYKWTFLF